MVHITNHCKQQMSLRGITEDQILKCIYTGVRLINKHNPLKLTIVDNIQRILVVTNKEATVAVTTFLKEEK